MMMKVSFKL